MPRRFPIFQFPNPPLIATMAAAVIASVRTALRLVEPGGTAILIGIPHGEITVSIAALVRRQVRVIGSLIYDHPTGFERTSSCWRRTGPGHRILGEPFELASAQEALANGDHAREASPRRWRPGRGGS